MRFVMVEQKCDGARDFFCPLTSVFDKSSTHHIGDSQTSIGIAFFQCHRVQVARQIGGKRHAKTCDTLAPFLAQLACATINRLEFLFTDWGDRMTHGVTNTLKSNTDSIEVKRRVVDDGLACTGSLLETKFYFAACKKREMSAFFSSK
jgi:hypothetical protein